MEIFGILKRSAPGHARILEDLFNRLKPSFALETESEKILFSADSRNNRIIIGAKGTSRLKAHALAISIFIEGRGTLGYGAMSPDERPHLYFSRPVADVGGFAPSSAMVQAARRRPTTRRNNGWLRTRFTQ